MPVLSKEQDLKRQQERYLVLALKANEEFNQLLGLLNKLYGLELPKLNYLEPTVLKATCSQLLEGTKSVFDAALSNASRDVRLTVAASTFLFRKRIPSPPNPGIGDEYIARMSIPNPDPDADFLAFCDKMIAKIFRPGWDRGYAERVKTQTISTSASYERKVLDGGSRALWVFGPGRETFEDQALGRETVNYDPRVRVSVVNDGGKPRVVTIAPAQRALLRPLHQMVYDHLSRHEWLLRGDAKASDFQSFTFKDGESFCSGDYESATDNLSLPVYKHLLDSVLRRALHTPEPIKDLARASATSEFWRKKPFREPEFLGTQQRGQLMGNYLSFPFLCLTNFLAFKYVVRRKVPLKINGDDIVFRATPEEIKRWSDSVEVSGLKLSPGKTLVRPRFFSLNSTFFIAGDKKARMLPVIRSKAFFKKGDSVQSMCGQYGSFCPGFGGHRRRFLQATFLRHHRNMVWRSGRSLTSCLGLRVPQSVLIKSSLWDRERFYLRLTSEKPLPPVPGSNEPGDRFGWVSKTAKDLWGWETVPSSLRREVRSLEPVMRNDRMKYDWSQQQFGELGNPFYKGWAFKQYWKSVSQSGYRYCSMPISRIRRLMKHSFAWLNPFSQRGFGLYRSNRSVFEREAVPHFSDRFWVPSLDSDPSGPAAFEPAACVGEESGSSGPEGTLECPAACVDPREPMKGSQGVYVPDFSKVLTEEEEIASMEARAEIEAAARVRGNPALQERIRRLAASLEGGGEAQL